MPTMLTPRFLGRAAVAGVLALTASAALAGETMNVVSSAEGETRSVAVRTSDLNLASASHRAKLASRIDMAARSACQMHAGSAIDALPSAQACYTSAHAGALAQLAARGIAVQQLALNTAR